MKHKSQWGKIKGEKKRINLERDCRHISKGVTGVAGGAGVAGRGLYPYERHRLMVVLRSGDKIDRRSRKVFSFFKEEQNKEKDKELSNASSSVIYYCLTFMLNDRRSRSPVADVKKIKNQNSTICKDEIKNPKQ
ncbi:hypothetical protein L6452_18820 [Arctium lappa]|uniref:Uncharacterized protein n=1 Tax=Arctium lappa TaxID=4217 RepID=A0ACB9C785_ARCLA|nr:hypothetical protein L6452_18820 [Arctium lappa]